MPACRLKLITTGMMLCVFISLSASAAKQLSAPDFIADSNSCIQCHKTINPQLVSDWQTSTHGAGENKADCISCHGNEHKKSAQVARADTLCVNCHGDSTTPVIHSYQLSKHGIIMRLERKQYDWALPLRSANYRTPGCAYCHMHANNHNVSTTVRRDIMDQTQAEAIKDTMRGVCQDCHAPRYITRLFDNAEAMLAVARSKVREAGTVIENNREQFTKEQMLPLTEQYKIMQHHLNNILIGGGHQSPDYQWWHGQPALDGDLLRIKSMLGDLIRESAIKH